MITQREKQEIGQKWENEITKYLKNSKLWNHKLINAGYGTVFDKIIIPPGGGYAIEIKARENGRIAYNKTSITPNEIKGLTKFAEMVGADYAYIVGIWTTQKKIYVIRWVDVMEEVTSGRRGSIIMSDHLELQRIKGGFDFSIFQSIGGY